MWVFKSRGCRTSSASYLKVILQLLPLVLFFYSYRVFTLLVFCGCLTTLL